MADTSNNVRDVPENWGGYSRMLGDLPLRSLPEGADGRLQAHLAAAVASPPSSSPSRLVRAVSLSASVVAVITAVVVFSPSEQPIAPSISPSSSVSNDKPKRRVLRSMSPPPEAAPQISDPAFTIDTSVPPSLIPPHRAPDAVTGGDRTGSTHPSAGPSRQRSDHSGTP